MSLRPRERDVLEAIDQHIRANRSGPTYLEISARIGGLSKPRICTLVGQLERRGYLRRRGKGTRGMEVLRLPDGEAATPDMDALRDLAARTGFDLRTYLLELRALGGYSQAPDGSLAPAVLALLPALRAGALKNPA